jgi:hypothetical protein
MLRSLPNTVCVRVGRSMFCMAIRLWSRGCFFGSRFADFALNFSIIQQARARGVIECRDKDSKVCRHAASFKVEVSGVAKSRGSLPQSIPAARRIPPRCGPMCQTRADPTCKFVHNKVVKAVFKFARANKQVVNDLDVVVSLTVCRGGESREFFGLFATYLEPKTAGIPTASLVILGLGRRQDRETLLGDLACVPKWCFPTWYLKRMGFPRMAASSAPN